MLKVITVTTNIDEARPLLNSLEKHGWATECLLVPEWKGFGTKLLTTYDFLKSHTEITEFIFCDAFDVVALGGPDEFRRLLKTNNPNVICSAERGLWPPTMEIYRPLYTKYPHRFDYANSGCYYAKSETFISMIEADKPEYDTDDQKWFNLQFIGVPRYWGIVLDNDQRIFNSYSFIDEGEYGYENGRLQINGNQPLFVHGNGRTDMTKIYELANTI